MSAPPPPPPMGGYGYAAPGMNPPNSQGRRVYPQAPPQQGQLPPHGSHPGMAPPTTSGYPSVPGYGQPGVPMQASGSITSPPRHGSFSTASGQPPHGSHAPPPPPNSGGPRPPIPPPMMAGGGGSPAPGYGMPPGMPSGPGSMVGSPVMAATHPGHAPHAGGTHRRKLYPDQAATAYDNAPQAYPGSGFQPTAMQQQQQGAGYGNGIPGVQQPGPGVGGGFSPAGGMVPNFGQSPQMAAYAQPGAVSPTQPGFQQSMTGMQAQFGQMGLGPLHSVPLMGPPNVAAIDAPPAAIRLPPNATLLPSATSIPSPAYKRATINAVPGTPSLAKKSRLPLGVLVTPHHSNETEESVPTVMEITRCRRCRTYINPYVIFVEQGRRWKCNMCFVLNDVPTFFDYDMATQRPVDRWQRAELSHAIVEFLAPSEYMVRPPQPNVYFFVIDVSYAAIQSGMLDTFCAGLLASLDHIPNRDERTKVGFMAVDTAIHFFALNPSLPEPQMMVVSDLDDVFLPQPDDLLCNLVETREQVETLLTKLPDMFRHSQVVGNALGAALQGAYKLINPLGGKIIVIQNSLPSVGPGALKPREDSKLLGTPKETSLLQPSDPFYKNFSVDCSRTQVCIDLFLASSQYADVATLTCLPRFTGGHHYFYPGFNAARPEDRHKFTHELGHFMANRTGLEAVMRVRASKGIRLSAFHGNFFLRSMDLLALPSVTPDHGYAVEYQVEEEITTPVVCFQTAILHTSCDGERRIRVLTMTLPVASSLTELYQSADPVAIMALLAKKGVERTLSAKLDDARDALVSKVAEILGTYKTELTSSQSGAVAQLQVSDSLQLLPVLMLSMVKHVAFRAGSQVPSDLRSHAQGLLTLMSPEDIASYLHPYLYSLHNMPPEAGEKDDATGAILMPPRFNLSSEKLERHGCYLIDDGHMHLMWLGKNVSPRLIQDLFNIEGGYDALRGGKQMLPETDHPFNMKVRSVLAGARARHANVNYPSLFVVKEDGDPALRLWFLSFLIEDRTGEVFSYPQWLTYLKERVNNGNY